MSLIRTRPTTETEIPSEIREHYSTTNSTYGEAWEHEKTQDTRDVIRSQLINSLIE